MGRDLGAVLGLLTKAVPQATTHLTLSAEPNALRSTSQEIHCRDPQDIALLSREPRNNRPLRHNNHGIVLELTSEFDNYWWQDDNVTALCTGNCSTAASEWLDNLGDDCYKEYITEYGRSLPVSSVPLRYVDGMNIICLETWADSDPAPTHPWCLTGSQEWQSSDIICANCTVNPSDSTCGGNASSIPDENIRLATLRVHLPTAGQGCSKFASSHKIAPTQLYAYNPVLGLDGVDCSTALWASKYYCIRTQSATATSAPGPTRTGIVTNCNKYAAAIADNRCKAFALQNSISAVQLDRQKELQHPAAGQKVLLRQRRAQRGYNGDKNNSAIISNYNKYVQPNTDQSCYNFAIANGITPAQLYAWNPVLKTDNANCGTKFFAENYYCISVSASSTITTAQLYQ
ncbi:hypothetical protein HD806DRAFT_547669 [Xylariaceae sp. AK1471]|nr:hypothetical protein HD806DRAFT_547669 [Xylariaceae sp. AK1471]